MENAPPTLSRLEAFFDHILSLQTAPALRSSWAVPFNVESMLDSILQLLSLDFVHIKLHSIALDGAPIEMTRLATFGHQESQLPAFRQLLDSLPAVNEAIYPVILPNPVGEGDVTIVSCRLPSAGARRGRDERLFRRAASSEEV